MTEDSTDRIEIFTDGACSGNPGPGGWGAIMRYRGTEKEPQSGEAETTNHRMEMLAAIMAMAAINRPARAVIPTASPYRRHGTHQTSRATEIMR